MGQRLDTLFAMLMALLANIFRGKGGKKHSPKDFMPQWESPAKPQTVPEAKPASDLLAKIEHLNKMFGGKDLRKK